MGENKTIESLNIDESAGLSAAVLKGIARACAMNKYKSGSLIHLSMTKAIGDYYSLQNFFDWFKISEKTHELWYGDKKVADEMKGK